MDEKTFKQYLDERYYPQINWYDKKSMYNQKIYKTLQWIVIVIAAVTPVFVALIDKDGTGKVIPIVFSSVVAIASALLKTFKYQENWINYRTTCETLRKEIYYYNAGIDEYPDSDDPMSLFVERVEALISRENTIWLTAQKKKKAKS